VKNHSLARRSSNQSVIALRHIILIDEGRSVCGASALECHHNQIVHSAAKAINELRVRFLYVTET
jgi:hypothetical protein